MKILGFDIGGTKCAVVAAEVEGDNVKITEKKQCATSLQISPCEMIARLIEMADSFGFTPERIGVSCGGPLDSKKGVIMSPPNLPGWDNVEIVKILEEHYGVPSFLQNDANACAVAEWKFGAGKGTENMIFLTFGTGLGAGLILDGRLYEGTNGNAGEVGHIRLEKDGPEGYGKKGSFEGFCSGGGLSRLGYAMALEQLLKGICPAYFSEGMSREQVSAKALAEAAEKGDETALDVFALCGKKLGMGLSVLIDILNPQKIVIGSIFARSGHLMREYAEKEIEKEALGVSAQCCQIVPAALGESIGDYAAIGVAVCGVNV